MADPIHVQGRGVVQAYANPFTYNFASDVASGNLVVVTIQKWNGSTQHIPVVGDVGKSAGSTAILGAWQRGRHRCD
jgi:hypothetical protein